MQKSHSLYVPPAAGEKLAEGIIRKKVPLVFLNPGAESDALIRKLKGARIEVRAVCSILTIGVRPETL